MPASTGDYDDSENDDDNNDDDDDDGDDGDVSLYLSPTTGGRNLPNLVAEITSILDRRNALL